MTEARVQCGACGFEITIRAQTDAEGRIVFEFEGACPAVERMAAQLRPYDILTDGRTMFTTSVYQAADATLRHVDCVVPAAVVRTAQVEAGLALPHSVELTVERK